MAQGHVLELTGITKRFPGVVALRDVSLNVSAGSCHALVGENGAGKSTLGKIIAGIHRPDEGVIRLGGAEVQFTDPRQAIDAGIGMVHQELSFCENLSVAENLCLGRLPSSGPFVSKRLMYDKAKEWLESIGSYVDVARRLGELPISQQQLVQIATAVSRGAKVLIFDEPTSSLSLGETQQLFELIRRLQSQGITSIYVSHRLPEVFSICDMVTVLRDGQVVGTNATRDLDERKLVQMMIGRALDDYFPAHLEAKPGDELLRVEGLTSPGKFTDISFTLRAGEVLGFAGLMGSGRTELAEAIFGLDPNATGKIHVAGNQVSIGHPVSAMKHGVGLVPEDRKRHGLVLSMTVRQNLSLPILETLSTGGWVRAQQERELSNQFFKQLRVRAASDRAVIASLSGGNQQKIVLAKWLAARCRILLVDEPTRGVDVGAKAEMHLLIDKLAHQGSAVLLISSELPEVLNLSTRIIVLREGRIAGEVSREQASQEALMRLMAGLNN